MAAGFQVRDASADRTINAIRVIDATGVDRNITEARIIDTTGTDRVFFSAGGGGTLSANASPNPVSGTTAGTGTAVSNSTTVTPTGGTTPYTYAWARTSYSHPTVPPTIGSPASATTTFTQTSIGTGEDYAATFRCTVTDSLGATATADVSAVWADTA